MLVIMIITSTLNRRGFPTNGYIERLLLSIDPVRQVIRQTKKSLNFLINNDL